MLICRYKMGICLISALCFLFLFIGNSKGLADCTDSVGKFEHEDYGTEYGDGIDGPYINNGDSTVTDESTDLMWQQRDDGNKYNWKEACQYCDNLTLGGNSDWELPDIFDLETIVDKNYSPATINDTYFTSVKYDTSYWSGSIKAYSSSDAWHVNFYDGSSDDSGDIDSTQFYVRCVRYPNRLSFSITASQTNGDVPLTVSFSSNIQSGTSPLDYLWDFGDDSSSTSTEPNPSHTYTSEGKYTATLTVSDGAGQTTSQDIDISANQPATYSLDCSVSPLNSGTVELTPDNDIYTSSQEIRLTAVPNPGYQFSGWSGDVSGNQESVTIAINKDTSVIAVFEEATFTVDITVFPAGKGTVSISPEKSSYKTGDTIALNAEAVSGSGFVFDHWEGDYSGSKAAATLPVTQNFNITAIFISVNELTVSPSTLELTSESSELLNAAGGLEPYIWTTTSGTLTPNTGPKTNYQAPSAPGNYTVTVSDSQDETAACSVTVYSEVTVSPNIHTMEIADTAEFEVSGGKSPYSVSVSAGSASAMENGKFVYSASDEAGNVTLTITDTMGQKVSVAVTVTKAEPLKVTPEEVVLRPSENVNFTATGGSPQYTWSADAGQLLATQGKTVTYVAPEVSREAPYVITLTDNQGKTATVEVTVINTLNLSPQLVSVVLRDATSVPFMASGGAQPFRWEADGGQIEGTGSEIAYMPPAEQGTYNLLLKDSADSVVKAMIRVVSVPQVTPAKIVSTTGESFTLLVSGGREPYQWSAEAGNLSQTKGTAVGYTSPAVNGLYAVTVQDALGHSSKCQIQVAGNLIIMPMKVVADVDEPIELAAARGIEPYSWPDCSQSRTWETTFNQVGRHEVVVRDAAGDSGLAVVEVIHSSLGVTPATTRLKPGEVVNLFVVGGTTPYIWTAEAGSLSNLEGDRVGYVAPDDPGEYVITVLDGRDEYGKSIVQVTSEVIALDGSVQTDGGSISSGVVVDGINCPGQRVLIDQSSHVELNFPLEVPDDNRRYNIYGALVYNDPGATEPLILFRTSNLTNPFVQYTDGALPVYTTVEAGSSIVVNFYRGKLMGVPGSLLFFVGYAPEKDELATQLIFNLHPYMFEIQ